MSLVQELSLVLLIFKTSWFWRQMRHFIGYRRESCKKLVCLFGFRGNPKNISWIKLNQHDLSYVYTNERLSSYKQINASIDLLQYKLAFKLIIWTFIYFILWKHEENQKLKNQNAKSPTNSSNNKKTRTMKSSKNKNNQKKKRRKSRLIRNSKKKAKKFLSQESISKKIINKLRE
jgi:hypothetical protein